MSTPGAAAEALSAIQNSFAAAAASANGDPPTCWGEEAELQRRFPAESPDVLNLNALPEEQVPLPEGSVCRFLCHVQQPLNPECFIGAVYREGRWESSKFRESLPDSAATGSKSVLWTRQAYRCSLIPGAATWWQQEQQRQQQHINQQQQQQLLALRGCVILFYPTEGVTLPKLNETIEVIGFCWGGTDAAADQFVATSESCDCGALSSLSSGEAPELLRLHAFAFRRLILSPPERPFPQTFEKAIADSWEPQRRRALEFLKSSFDGDALAAEYALLALCSRPVLEQQDVGMAFHRLRVAFIRSHGSGVSPPAQEKLGQPSAAANALGCEGEAPARAAANDAAAPSAVASQPCICPLLSRASRRLLKSCKELVPCATAVSVHPEALLQQRLCPQLRLAEGDVNEDLLSTTPLQLPPGCVVVVDEPQSLERDDLEPLLRRRALATATTAAAANQKGKDEESTRQKAEADKTEDDSKTKQKQQQQHRLERELLQQEIGASVSAIQMLITDGNVPYDFVAGIRPIATDCSVLLFTHEGRDSHFDGLLRIPLAASDARESKETKEQKTEVGMQELRQLLSLARDCSGGLRLHPEVRETAVTDFVRKRQQYDDISSDDFQHWLLVAAAVAASHGSFMQRCKGTDVTEEAQANAEVSSQANGLEVVVEPKHWQHAQQLEDERRRRLRAYRQQQESDQRDSQLKYDAASLVARAATLSLS